VQAAIGGPTPPRAASTNLDGTAAPGAGPTDPATSQQALATGPPAAITQGAQGVAQAAAGMLPPPPLVRAPPTFAFRPVVPAAARTEPIIISATPPAITTFVPPRDAALLPLNVSRALHLEPDTHKDRPTQDAAQDVIARCVSLWHESGDIWRHTRIAPGVLTSAVKAAMEAGTKGVPAVALFQQELDLLHRNMGVIASGLYRLTHELHQVGALDASASVANTVQQLWQLIYAVQETRDERQRALARHLGFRAPAPEPDRQRWPSHYTDRVIWHDADDKKAVKAKRAADELAKPAAAAAATAAATAPSQRPRSREAGSGQQSGFRNNKQHRGGGSGGRGQPPHRR